MAALALGAVSVVLLFATELTTLSERRIGNGGCSVTIDPGLCATSGGDAHSYILWLVAAAVAVFTFGAAIGRSRPAALALMACGAVVLVIALALDLPDVDDTRGLDARYADVTGHAGPALTLEIVGGLLAVAAGLLLLVWPPVRSRRAAGRGRRAGGRPPPPPPPPPPSPVE